MVTRVLIANRGEIALRILRTLRILGIQSVVIYHESDHQGPAVVEADEAIEIHGDTPVAAYLDIDCIVAACRASSADAVHPGYGFLSENASFATKLACEGITFIGPGPEAIEVMGDKITAKRMAVDAGVNIIPGHADAVTSAEGAGVAAAELGYPVMFKAAAGGGGKGMRIVGKKSECARAFELASGEARASFGDERVFVEKYIEGARHIEIQILADAQGGIIHLGERECSIQRRHQKIIEEAPSPFLDDATRQAMGEQAVALARTAGYRSAGTVEFVVDVGRNFYFLEMNTRLQVEHPVTELVTGIDLVAEQIRIARGEPLALGQDDIHLTGHAIECRIYAEDADAGFLPATGTVLMFKAPEDPGLRFDHGIVEGLSVSSAFDPMLGKLLSHGDTRKKAVDLALEALHKTVIFGVKTNIDFMTRVLQHHVFAAGAADTGFIAQHENELIVAPASDDELSVLIAAAALATRSPCERRYDLPEPLASFGGWRN